MDEEMFLRAISKVIHNRTDSQFYRPGRSILLFKHFYPISNLRHRLSSLVSYNILTYVAAALKRGRCVCVCGGEGGWAEHPAIWLHKLSARRAPVIQMMICAEAIINANCRRPGQLSVSAASRYTLRFKSWCHLGRPCTVPSPFET